MNILKKIDEQLGIEEGIKCPHCNEIISEDLLMEKWAKEVKVKKTGEHAEKSESQIKSEIERLKGKPKNKEQMGGLLFALRAKGGWKKGEGAADTKKD